MESQQIGRLPPTFIGSSFRSAAINTMEKKIEMKQRLIILPLTLPLVTSTLGYPVF